ncbi:MAG: putative Phosphoribosyltransferase [Candidatus Saccharibacteria bacterium]|nr:putative Phosphoribosyltransferase [Candidatus Saccharibacteria bacterium]
MSILDSLLAIIAPHDCLGCATEGVLLCQNCRRQIVPAPAIAIPPGPLDAVIATTRYNGLAKELVHRLKFSGSQAAAREMAGLFPIHLLPPGALVMPVPTATSRIRQRGYDQAALLARHLARAGGMPYRSCLRRRGQQHQVGASRQQRLAQLARAYRVVHAERLVGTTVVIVDDVMTTGATLQAAAAVLKQAGASRVEAMVFAQA